MHDAENHDTSPGNPAQQPYQAGLFEEWCQENAPDISRCLCQAERESSG